MEYLRQAPVRVVRLSPVNAPTRGSVSTLLLGGMPKEMIAAAETIYASPKNPPARAKAALGKNWSVMLGLADHADHAAVGGAAPEDALFEFDEGDPLRGLEIEDIGAEPSGALHAEDAEVAPTDVPPTRALRPTEYAPPAVAYAPLPAEGTTYKTSDVTLFPEDKLSELKEKIYVATGVPTFRQHLFWVDEAGVVRLPYRIRTADGGGVVVDARALLHSTPKESSSDVDKVFGIPVDQYVYNNIDGLQVVAMDTFKTIETAVLGVTSTLYVIDLADVLFDPQTRASLLTDVGRRDLVYKSVVFKYWPWITEAVFPLVLSNERELQVQYPLLAPSLPRLKEQFKVEARLLGAGAGQPRAMDVAITMALTSVTTGARIDVRNLFDRLATTPEAPSISAYFSRTNVTKHRVGAPAVVFPPQTRSGLTVAIPVAPDELYKRTVAERAVAETLTGSKRTYMFLNVQPDGLYYVLSHWGEEQRITFDTLLQRMMERVNPVITAINAVAEYALVGVARQLPLLSPVVARYPDINIALLWPKSVSDAGFKEMRALWDPYIDAAIMSQRPTVFGGPQATSVMEMDLLKGTVEYDIGQIARSSVLARVTNYYTYMTNADVRAVWEQMYHGRLVRMTHRTSDVKFELFNVTQGNLLRFRQYLNGYLAAAIRSRVVTAEPAAARTVRKLRKLQELDPELYDLRKHGSSRLYAVMCQERRQPLMFTEQEVKQGQVPAKLAKRMTKYVNFTTDRPAYYVCDDKEHNVLSFITGVHPKGYCLPCCKKRPALPNTKRWAEHAACLDKGTPYGAPHDTPYGVPKVAEITGARHVMTYGKELPLMRLGHPPKNVAQYLDATVGDSRSMFLVGVQQHYPGVSGAAGAGALAALALVAQEPPVKLADAMARAVRQMGTGYESLLGGDIVEWFSSATDLAAAIHELFVATELAASFFDRWRPLLVELFRIVRNMEVVVFTGGALEYAEETDRATVILVEGAMGMVYPLVRLSPDEYFRSGAIKARTFPGVRQVVGASKDKTKSATSTAVDLAELFEAMSKAGLTDVRVQLTPQRIAYGVSGFDGRDMVLVTAEPGSAPPGVPTTSRKISGVRPSKKLMPVLRQFGEVRPLPNKAVEVWSAGRPVATGYFTHTRDSVLEADAPKPDSVSSEDLETGAPKPDSVSSEDLETGAPKPDSDVGVVEMLTALAEGRPAEPDALDERLPDAISLHTAYSQLMMEFTARLDKHRDEETRAAIDKMLGELNINDGRSVAVFSSGLRALVGIDADVSRLTTIVAHTMPNVKEARRQIQTASFQFDKRNYDRMAALPYPQLLEEVRTIVAEIVAPADKRPAPPPNLALPCGLGRAQPHCAGARLQLPPDHLTQLSELLASDLHNPLKRELMRSGALSRFLLQDPYEFAQRPDEIVRIRAT